MNASLGITGGIGAGKSSVSRLLAAYCLAPLIDMDRSCRHLLEVGQPGWLALRDTLGPAFFLPDDEINRPALRERLFIDSDFRHRIDALLHPLAREAMRREVNSLRAPLILVEIPLLYEAGWQKDVDAVLVVHARRGVRCCRIMSRDGVTRRNATRAMASQMDDAVKVRRADFVIDNSGPWVLVREKIVDLGNRLSKGVPGNFGKKVLDSRT